MKFKNTIDLHVYISPLRTENKNLTLFEREERVGGGGVVGVVGGEALAHVSSLGLHGSNPILHGTEGCEMFDNLVI